MVHQQAKALQITFAPPPKRFAKKCGNRLLLCQLLLDFQ